MSDKDQLDAIVKEITDLAKEVEKEYSEVPSELSGSVTQVHESSPFLATREERLIKPTIKHDKK